MTAYHLNVTVHVLAALLWLGGMLSLAVVGAPVLRRVEPPELRARLFNQLGRAHSHVGWAAIAVLLGTGTLNLAFRGLLRMDLLASGDFWGSRYGTTLAWKLAAVATMIVISVIHDFVLGPAAYRATGTARAGRLRGWSAWLARANAIVGIVLVYVAVRLARGG